MNDRTGFGSRHQGAVRTICAIGERFTSRLKSGGLPCGDELRTREAEQDKRAIERGDGSSDCVGHPAVAEAAVIGIYHPKWDERPLLIVQLKAGQNTTREDILKFMDGKIAKWWMPDDVVFVDGIPHTATGKILKTALREQFKSYRFPNAAA